MPPVHPALTTTKARPHGLGHCQGSRNSAQGPSVPRTQLGSPRQRRPLPATCPKPTWCWATAWHCPGLGSSVGGGSKRGKPGAGTQDWGGHAVLAKEQQDQPAGAHGCHPSSLLLVPQAPNPATQRHSPPAAAPASPKTPLLGLARGNYPDTGVCAAGMKASDSQAHVLCINTHLCSYWWL